MNGLSNLSMPNFNLNVAKTSYLYVWIDILGFSEALNDEKKYSELISLIKEFRKNFKNHPNAQKTLTISDGIVLIFKIKNASSIRKIFSQIAKAQLNFIKEHKYLLRGGMAVGSVEQSEIDEDLKYLVSSGLSNAYLSESNFISYPVIGMAEKYLKELNRVFSPIDLGGFEDCGLLKTNSKRRSEPLYFIDFLSLEQEDKEIREFIENKLKEYQGNPSVLEKYIWLYRFYCERFDEFDIKKIGEIVYE